MLIRVQNGTCAARRIIKQLEPWRCDCPPDIPAGHVLHDLSLGIKRKRQPGDRYSCPDCGARRPSS